MPTTALQHFREDCARARALLRHAEAMPRSTSAEQLLRSDLLRSSWMFAVGALDAYFCDAYTDLIAATIISKERQAAIALPEFFNEIRFPIRAILEPYDRGNWRWRMAARNLMERENVLSLATVQKLFNKFFRPRHKLFADVLPSWIVHPDSKKRRFGITPRAFQSLASAGQRSAVDDAKLIMDERYRAIFQRRHDCIHNCDRPRVSPQRLVLTGTVEKVIEDVEFLVARCDEHIQSEFREFLLGIGCNATTASQAGY